MFTPSGRRGGDCQPGAEDTRQGGNRQTRPDVSWQSRQSHISKQMNQRDKLRSRETLQPRSQPREIKSQSLRLKEPVGVEAVGGNHSPTWEFVGKNHRVLEQPPSPDPPWNQHQKDPISLWEMGEMTEIQPRDEQSILSPPGPLARVWWQNRGKSECYDRWNKGNQQWKEGNWDSNQRLRWEEENKHSTKTE